MRKDKVRAFELRKEGKTYNQIRDILNVSKGTLSFWFSNFDWSRDIHALNHKTNYSPEKVRAMHAARRQLLDEHYKLAEKEALQEYKQHKNESLFISGLMLYAGEGDKSFNNGQVRIANADPTIVLVFKRFLECYYPHFRSNIRLSLLLYPDLSPQECIDWWRKALCDQDIQMHKPVVILGRHKTRRLQYGVASLIISNKFLKTKLLKLMRLTLENLTRP